MPKLIDEKDKLQKRVDQYEKEFEIVDWYISFFERGIDTKELARKHFELCEIHDELKNSSSRRITYLENEVERLTTKLEATLKKLKQQQERVVKPLIAECASREK